MTQLTVRRADYRHPLDRAALVTLLDTYARDPMGGGTALTDEVRARLCDDMTRLRTAASFIAWMDEEPVGLVNTFAGYSTFKARPLLNVHDIVVRPPHRGRGRGIGLTLLAACEAHAREQGCCKPTLEVLSGNTRALRNYARHSFASYVLDPRQGQAMMMQKWLEPDA